ncbi:helix-turn-helix domain-containing protein [Brevibacillus laterosporus]|uniref:helix-turn-helix domain-containing protein n=1 Tax=Brevibacillus laterosporus TaxID=1465 RepID=UPI001EF3B45F|nr:helix-turn-helix transcriptional regulator [Brevibacillus laterosporus]MCG7318669.1 helix-turn-helix transcriptional regulator [Brevibacillus laterosporus]
MSESLTFTTLGELIKIKRLELGISLSELGRLSGISKGVLSKIESGETKRPELKTLKPIAEVLSIPYEEIIERYIEIEHRHGIYDDFITEAIEISNPSLITKVVIKFLENSNKDTYTTLEQVYKLASIGTNNDVKVALYNSIIKYARVHGLPNYITKGLYQKYLIEREDLKYLEESFKVGEEVLNYTDFMRKDEKVHFYYKISLHAHNIERYEKCIEYGEKGHEEDTTNNKLKERVALAILNSHSRLGKYIELEKHLEMYARLGYRLIIEKVKYFRAIILSKTGQYYEAIPLLKDCIEEATVDNRLHRVNDLLEVLFKINDTVAIQQILGQEERNTNSKISPYKYLELGKYFRYKGRFLVKHGLFDDGMEAYLKSMYFYSEINARHNIMECSEYIYSSHCDIGKQIELSLLERITEVYNKVNKGNEKER